MTLRRRLGVAIVALLVITAVAFGTVFLTQRGYQLSQLDDRLVGLSGNTKVLVAISTRAEAGNGRAADLLTDVYVGVQRANGGLRTVMAPDSDPTLLPALLGNERDAGAVTRATSSGTTQRVRLVEAFLGGQRYAVVALSMEGVEAQSRRLAIALGLAWLVVAGVALLAAYWVDRLGLRPIAELTAAAEHVTATGGRAAVQVRPGDQGTEAGRLGTAFNAMVATTAGGQDQLRRFVADASHELRTPLTTLRGYSSLYAQGGLTTDEQVADAMGRINAEATRMGRIVDDLLDLTALGDRSALELAAVDLASVLDDLAADLRVRNPDREVTVQRLGRTVALADSDRIRQALTALIANAVKYSADGSPVQLAAEQRGQVVRVQVADQGRGITAEDLPRVFDRFYRVAGGGPRGSGLGLAVVAAIVSAHDGRYGVKSEAGIGSVFWIELAAGPLTA